MEVIDNRHAGTMSSEKKEVIVRGSIVKIHCWKLGMTIILDTGYNVVLGADEMKQITEAVDKI